MGDLIEHGLPCKHCGSSDAVAQYTTNYFCFSCERSTPIRKLDQILEIAPAIEDQCLPKYKATMLKVDQHYSYLPFQKAVSIAKNANMTNELLYKYDIHMTADLQVWSKRKQAYVSMGPRLIIPHPGGFEAKTLANSHIKYITAGHKDRLFVAYDWPGVVERVCIVEDIFSAIRIGEFMPCVSLIGTNLTKTKERQLWNMSKRFLIWLDSDRAGRKATAKISSRLEWVAESILTQVSTLDPKCYTDEQLEELLDEKVS
jgi:hypothetical protein